MKHVQMTAIASRRSHDLSYSSLWTHTPLFVCAKHVRSKDDMAPALFTVRYVNIGSISSKSHGC